MTAAQPRVASRAAPHGGGPAYLPRLKQAERVYLPIGMGTNEASKAVAGMHKGPDCGRRTAPKYHDSLRSFSKHPTGGRAV
jgi:hypothetical protein